jgi:hypothetical protein
VSELSDIIASEKLFGQRTGEERFSITIEIGRPYKWGGDSSTEWACPVSVAPFDTIVKGSHGEGSFQALCLALRTVQLQLVHFREQGGKITLESGDEFPLDAYWRPNEYAAAVMSDKGVA